MLGEMHVTAGRVSVHGTLAYATQQPWTQNRSVQDNITFGLPFDAAWYRLVLKACALGMHAPVAGPMSRLHPKVWLLLSRSEDDLAGLADGDATLVGEDGAAVSGGQKQRICLARGRLLRREPLSVIAMPATASTWLRCAALWALWCVCIRSCVRSPGYSAAG
jgi:ABC-type multidrug transport system fused ATPase/permease subunit